MIEDEKQRATHLRQVYVIIDIRTGAEHVFGRTLLSANVPVVYVDLL